MRFRSSVGYSFGDMLRIVLVLEVHGRRGDGR